MEDAKPQQHFSGGTQLPVGTRLLGCREQPQGNVQQNVAKPRASKHEG